MPRKLFRKYVPTAASVRENRWIAKFGTLLHHPNLWHLNRDSVAGAVAIGLFAGLIPGPLQMLVALGLTLAFLGYWAVQLFWRCQVTLAWRRRKQRRYKRDS